MDIEAPARKFHPFDALQYWCNTEKSRRKFSTRNKQKLELQKKSIVVHCGFQQPQPKPIKWYKMYYSLQHLYRYCVERNDTCTVIAFAFMRPPTIMSQVEDLGTSNVAKRRRTRFIVDTSVPGILQVYCRNWKSENDSDISTCLVAPIRAPVNATVCIYRYLRMIARSSCEA